MGRARGGAGQGVKYVLISLFAIVGLAACSGGDAPVQEVEPPLYKYASIMTAMGEAQATLDVFWDHFEANAAGEEQFRVKIIEPSDAYARDYVWVEYLQQAGETEWRGAVIIENGGNERFTTGQTLDFAAADIVDWAYREDDRERGAYTTRAMLDLAPDADTGAIRATFHESPVP